jgi:DNA polymerase elongation subunit (family B)
MEDKKQRLAELKKKKGELQRRVEQLYIQQFTYKILINRIYGYFGNKYAPMGDGDIARSITLTGQNVIKKSNEIIRNFNKLKTGNEVRDENDPILYNDTDSVYCTVKHILRSQSIELLNSHGNVNKQVYDLAKELEEYLNTEIKKWAMEELNSLDPRFVFKRESICDVGLFLQKKRYILHKLDDEGVKCNKFKYTGVEVVRTAMPKKIKPLVKNVIEHMLLSRDYTSTNKMYNELFKTFCDMEVEEIAFTMGVNNYEKYAARCQGFKAGLRTPIHVKCAYFYNKLLEDQDLSGKYETLSSGDKVKFFYVEKPNKLGIDSIGYKYQFPKEFKDFLKPDKNLMFEKIVSGPVERLYEAVGWKFFPPGSQLKVNLFEMFA